MATPNGHRPKILDMLRYAGDVTRKGDIAVLQNADCLLTSTVKLMDVAEFGDHPVIMPFHRWNIGVLPRSLFHALAYLGREYTYGYDAFAMNKAAVELMWEAFQNYQPYLIGEPWWDYAFLYCAIERNVMLLAPPKYRLLHVWHPTQFERSVWDGNGQSLKRRILRDRRNQGDDVPVHSFRSAGEDTLEFSNALNDYIRAQLTSRNVSDNQ
ncbi:hypothetical protein GYB61_01060 [bacterium]|nr:hypothetical protein [bacterium]